MTRLTFNSDMLPFIDIEIVERVIDWCNKFSSKVRIQVIQLNTLME